MKYLTESKHTLLDLVTMDGKYYWKIKYDIHSRTRSQNIFELIDECRSIVNFNKSGSNIIRYLLHTMNNKIIKQQYVIDKNEKLCMLCLNNRSIPFDELPLISSLYRHNPRGSDLFECIDLNNREDELLYRYIKNNTEKNGILYTPIEEINNKEKLSELVNSINKKFIPQHYFRKLVIEKDYIYIKS
ncbi:MAG TPA: helicase, partial [Clostridiales bacterium]|nr:helicase [Clostridiales bacterium]